MLGRYVAGALLVLVSAGPLKAQIPSDLSGRLLFTFGTADGGGETYFIKRSADGYQLGADVEIQVSTYHIVQHIEVEAGERLQFRTAEVRATVNGATTLVGLTRRNGYGVEERTTGGSTSADSSETPESSVLLTNNVIIHIAQFAWLHDGEVGASREFLAFPRVPITAVLEDASVVTVDGASLSVRRYYLNVANQLGAYVWLADDGTPLKISVPLQAFYAVSEAHQEWADVLVVPRDQPEPEPSAYDAEEVQFESGAITLAGTLTTPKSGGPWPAAVLITGSGAQDRDENSPGPGGLQLSIFRTIADTLTRRGIAVLRYDDRGVGGSGGSLADAGLSDLVGDVESAVGYLRGRPEIDDARIVLVGHSEGGIIAPIVAVADRRVAALVLMAGTSAPLDSVIVEQVVLLTRAAGGDSADVAEARDATLRFMLAIREEREPEDVEFSAGQQKWLREHIEHDPLATLCEVDVPLLIVNGGQDVQVAPEHARRMGAALEEVGHPDYEVRIFPELNHLFAVSRGEGVAEYADPNAEVDPQFLSYLADWLVTRLKP